VRLLLIEDDEEAAHFILKGLRESGYTVDHAACSAPPKPTTT
jgi:DNA-binding response OmpR family regulator